MTRPIRRFTIQSPYGKFQVKVKRTKTRVNRYEFDRDYCVEVNVRNRARSNNVDFTYTKTAPASKDEAINTVLAGSITRRSDSQYPYHHAWYLTMGWLIENFPQYRSLKNWLTVHTDVSYTLYCEGIRAIPDTLPDFLAEQGWKYLWLSTHAAARFGDQHRMTGTVAYFGNHQTGELIRYAARPDRHETHVRTGMVVNSPDLSMCAAKDITASSKNSIVHDTARLTGWFETRDDKEFHAALFTESFTA